MHFCYLSMFMSRFFSLDLFIYVSMSVAFSSSKAAGADGDGKLGTKRHSGDLDSSLAGRHFETIKELKRQIGSLTEEL